MSERYQGSRYCRDCRWHRHDRMGVVGVYSACYEPEVMRNDPVNGPLPGICDDERKNEKGLCGANGSRWEKRRPKWWVNLTGAA